MITVIARWDHPQMPHDVEFRMWKSCAGPFGVQRMIMVPRHPDYESSSWIHQCETMEEALQMAEGEVCFLEPTGLKNVNEIPKEGNITLVVGNTDQHNLHLAEANQTYAIAAPAGELRAHLYGPAAVAVALAIRFGQ